MTNLFPDLPYADLKWRWASKQPTEGLNRPDIYLGVLRALSSCEGLSKSSDEVFSALSAAEQALAPMHANIRLARSADRNLLRNSGQYWTALGVLAERQGRIQLSEFGREYAAGNFSYQDFGEHVVRNLQLPSAACNAREKRAWTSHTTPIEPLKFILQIMNELASRDILAGYISLEELGQLIQPLSIIERDYKVHADWILRFRANRSIIAEWPRMTDGANDFRIIREFLEFLSYYGFVELDERDRNRFLLIRVPDLGSDERSSLENPSLHGGDIAGVVPTLQRGTVWREMRHRPNQSAFRRSILRNAGSRCLLTGSTTERSLQAAHIRPVEFDGTDEVTNGLCLRADIHILFDAGLIKFYPNGEIRINSSIKDDATYVDLEGRIEIPSYVGLENLEWRLQFM